MANRRRIDKHEAEMRKKNRRGARTRRIKQTFVICGIAVIFLLVIYRLILNGLREKVEVESFLFTESAKELQNPNRGFYHLYRFGITEEATDYKELIEEKYQKDTDTEITLVQICLQAYRKRAIGETGLDNIDKLFSALETIDKQLIIRFMYDEEGENELYEPKNIEIILQHMEQLAPILCKADRDIFILQGLFTGNWGEMNGTQYSSAEDMRRLTKKLSEVTKESTYLSVRMPAQWRDIIGLDDPAEALENHILAGRLSLFNDGILGNDSDYGTYLSRDFVGDDEYHRWEREAEIDFQRILCCAVPNGGEVINANPLNDFESAVKELAAMHVTYLNADYDQEVLKKWEEETVTEEGCFEGMDGYSYIEQHLGYRLLIDDVTLKYSEEKNRVYVAVQLKNVGFAPLYRKPEIKMILYSEKEGQLPPETMSCAIHELVGGEESEVCQAAYAKVSLNELKKGKYEVYFLMEDPDTGRSIQMANEQEEEAYGYRIGTIVVR